MRINNDNGWGLYSNNYKYMYMFKIDTHMSSLFREHLANKFCFTCTLQFKYKNAIYTCMPNYFQVTAPHVNIEISITHGKQIMATQHNIIPSPHPSPSPFPKSEHVQQRSPFPPCDPSR